MANSGKFRKKLFSAVFRPFLIVKEQRATHCITYATLLSIVFLPLSGTIAARPRSADLILVNGNIRTLNSRQPRAEAIAVSDGKIVAVGTNLEIRKFSGERTKVIDAKGRLVLPGFNDAHVHFAAIGNKFSSIDLKGVRSTEEMAVKLAEYVRFLPKGRWILGGGFDPAVLNEASGKMLGLVDAATPENPVFVYSTDVNTAFANTLALTRSRLNKDAAAPTGKLTGSAVGVLASVVPPNHMRNWPEVIETATNYAASLGVTSVQDMHSDELADVHRQLDRAGKLKTRIYDCSPMSAAPKLAAAGVKAASGDAMVRTGCVKFFSEGDEAEVSHLRRDIAAADNAGLQVMIHAIGSRANAVVLDAFEWTAKANGSRDRRFRVEHAQNVEETDLSRFARSGIIASMQPWLFNGTNPLVYKRHLESGTRLAFGSDASIVEFNPLFGIFAATQGPDALSVEDAVRAYTVGAAYAEFQEKVKGTIEAGKVADLIILDKDIFTIPLSDIPNASVLFTYVDGKMVFASK